MSRWCAKSAQTCDGEKCFPQVRLGRKGRRLGAKLLKFCGEVKCVGEPLECDFGLVCGGLFSQELE